MRLKLIGGRYKGNIVDIESKRGDNFEIPIYEDHGVSAGVAVYCMKGFFWEDKEFFFLIYNGGTDHLYQGDLEKAFGEFDCLNYLFKKKSFKEKLEEKIKDDIY